MTQRTPDETSAWLASELARNDQQRSFNVPPEPYFTNITTDQDICAVNVFEHLICAYWGVEAMEWDGETRNAVAVALAHVGQMLQMVGLLDRKVLYEKADIDLEMPGESQG